MDKPNLLVYLNNIAFFANNILDLFKRTLTLGDCQLFTDRKMYIEIQKTLRESMMKIDDLCINN